MSETGNGGGGGARERGVMAGEEGVGGGCLGFGPPESDCGVELLRVAPSIPSARSLASQVAEAKREAGRRCAAAADLRREVDSLHGQLAKLQALLLLLSPPPPHPTPKPSFVSTNYTRSRQAQLKAAATKAMPRTAEIASQTEADLKVNVSPGFGRRASARTPSQCGPSLLQGAATSTNAVGGESPVMARASSVEADRAARSSCGGMPGHEVLDPTLWAGASAAAAPR